MDAPEPSRIEAKKVRPGPIRNKSLSPELLERIEAIYGVLGRYLGMKLEKFEIGFMRDMTPDSEVAIWSSIAAAWDDYHEKHLSGMVKPDAEEIRIVAALIAISAGETDVGKLPVRPAVGSLLLDCYDGLSK
jgi:hypothetical protein